MLPNYTQWSGMSCWRLMDHDETWSGKRRSFGEMNKMVIFLEKPFLKSDFLPFSTNIYFRENFLKEILYKGRFMGKRSKSLIFF